MVEMALSSRVVAGAASERMVAGAFKTSAGLMMKRAAWMAASARTEACDSPDAAKRNALEEKTPLTPAAARVRAARKATSAGDVRALAPAAELAERRAASDCAAFVWARADERPERAAASEAAARAPIIAFIAPVAEKNAPVPVAPRAA